MSVDKFCHLPRENFLDKKICGLPWSKICCHDIQIEMCFHLGAEESVIRKISMENTVSKDKPNFQLHHFDEKGTNTVKDGGINGTIAKKLSRTRKRGRGRDANSLL